MPLSKIAVVDDLAARLAARRLTAIGQRAGYERLALAIDGQPGRWTMQSDLAQSVIVAPEMAA